MDEDKNDMVSREDGKSEVHTREINTTARRYSRRDRRLGVILLPEPVLCLISI